VRRTLAWLVALGLLLGASGQNADPIEAAVQGLRRDPVFIDPAAQRALSDTEAERLREQIRSAGTPVFVAVLPTSAGDAQDVVRQLLQETDLAGTYAAVVGDSFRVTSTQLVGADELASAAFQAERDNSRRGQRRRRDRRIASRAPGAHRCGWRRPPRVVPAGPSPQGHRTPC
jgi:hypothetical protein